MAKTNHFGALAAAAGTLVAVGLVVLMMVVVEAGPAEAAFPGKNGRIAFVRDFVVAPHSIVDGQSSRMSSLQQPFRSPPAPFG
jgi:hypothetical protein